MLHISYGDRCSIVFAFDENEQRVLSAPRHADLDCNVEGNIGTPISRMITLLPVDSAAVWGCEIATISDEPTKVLINYGFESVSF